MGRCPPAWHGLAPVFCVPLEHRVVSLERLTYTGMERPHRILIIKLSSIGDVVHTLPAVADLKCSFPKTEIDWLVESKAGALLIDNPWLHEVIEIDTHRWRRSWSLATLGEMRRFASRLRRRRY